MSNKFNPSAVEGIDQSLLPNDGPQFPVISFHSGDPKLKKVGGLEYLGGWFIGEEGAPADMTEYGWVRDSFTTAQKQEVKGFWASHISISVICERKRWLVDGQPYAWDDYEKAKKGTTTPRGHQQYLVLLQGAEDLGPFVIGLRGHVGMCFSGSKKYSSTGVLSCFNRTVIAAANAMTKPARWHWRAFWITVGADKTAKGEPNFTEVGMAPNTTSIVLPVPIGLPEKAAEVNLDEYYVGDKSLIVINQLFTEHQVWAKAWESFTGQQPKTNGKPVGEPEVATEEDLEAMGV
jgi:hypothetical protein